MIERFYLKSCLSFEEAALEFEDGLIVFTGPSGSGKSVLMRAILASVGFDDAIAQLSESSVIWQIDEEKSGFSNEELNVFKQIKKEKVRYFLNHQMISKKALQGISKSYLRHLSLKDYSDFEQEKLLDILDDGAEKSDPLHKERLEAYRKKFIKYEESLRRLLALEKKEKQIDDLKEFAAFELAKIEKIAPKVGEYEALLALKKKLSQKEKSEEKIAEAQMIFSHEHLVSSALNALDISSDFFDDTMNELRSHFEKARNDFDEIETVDIETLLDRLEQLSDLNRRYGSIEEALLYAKNREKEIASYDNFSKEKSELALEVEQFSKQLHHEAAQLSQRRNTALQDVNGAINSYLKALYLNDAALSLRTIEPTSSGADKVLFELQGTPLEKISSGEFNRLRLALLAVKSESMKEKGGVLMLDEIDANLSGEESMSVARVLKKMSHIFQIFVISHQPQLTSMGISIF